MGISSTNTIINGVGHSDYLSYRNHITRTTRYR